MKEISNWRRRLKTSLTVGIVATMISISSASVHASSILDEITPEETIADYAEDTNYSILRGNNLNFGTVKVQRMSSN